MLKEIKIKNFLSFEDITIPIHPNVNILVGINGSGKSNLLKAIRLLKEGVAGIGLEKYVLNILGGFDNIYFNKPNDKSNANIISFEFAFDTKIMERKGYDFVDDFVYNIELIKSHSIGNFYIKEIIENLNGVIFLKFDDGEGQLRQFEIDNTNGSTLVKFNRGFINQFELALSKIFYFDKYNSLNSLRKAISEIYIYEFFDTTPNSLIRKPMLPTSEKVLLSDGSNLPQILNTIKINNKSVYNKIVEKFREVNPKFKGFDFNFIGGNIELMLEEDNMERSIHVSNISDGTLKYLCLLSILYNPKRGSLICIDEPETGLHPDMIARLGNCINEASKETCFIISTHSDTLLNSFEIENMRVFEKNETNGTQVLSYTQKDFEGWYEKFSVGNMWRNGDLGGNRW